MYKRQPLTFYSRYLWEIVRKHSQFLVLVLPYLRAMYRVETGAGTAGIADPAMTPVQAEEVEAMTLSRMATRPEPEVQEALAEALHES